MIFFSKGVSNCFPPLGKDSSFSSTGIALNLEKWILANSTNRKYLAPHFLPVPGLTAEPLPPSLGFLAGVPVAAPPGAERLLPPIPQ